MVLNISKAVRLITKWTEELVPKRRTPGFRRGPQKYVNNHLSEYYVAALNIANRRSSQRLVPVCLCIVFSK